MTLAGLCLAACNQTAGDDGLSFSTESQGTETSPPDPTAGSTGGTGADTEADTTAATEAGSSSDGGSDSSDSGADTEAPPVEPCTAVDVLFVVDNSDPMIEEQNRLRGAALAFVQQIPMAIPTLTEDVNIGVITTDDPLMVQANAEPCAPYEGGNNWMISSSTALATELDCALAVGTAGSPNERPMQMLIESLADENIAPGGFHTGFLRENALLVIVIATNEEDELRKATMWGSTGDPMSWAEDLASRKGGWMHDVVVLSLLGTEPPNACPPFQWDGTEGAQVSPRLIALTEMFPQGAVGDICEQEYATFLLGVVPGITAACMNYSPP